MPAFVKRYIEYAV